MGGSYKITVSRPSSPKSRRHEPWRKSVSSLNVALGLAPPPGYKGGGGSGDTRSLREGSVRQSRQDSQGSQDLSGWRGHSRMQSAYATSDDGGGREMVVHEDDYELPLPPGVRTAQHPHPPPPLFPPSPPESPRSPFKHVVLIPGIVALICLMFFITMAVNDCPHQYPPRKCVINGLKRFAFQPLAENPLLGPSSKTLLNMGALQSRGVTHGDPWRLLTCTWLHAGVFHLVSNLFGLLFIGWRLEKEFGPLQVGILYLLSGLGGAIMSALFLTDQISVGASAAVFGLLGGTTSELITNWTMYENKIAALLSLSFLIVINLIFGLMPFIDNFAHIGGLVSGFLLGFILLVKPTWSSYSNDLDFALDFQEQDGKKKPTDVQTFLKWTSLIFILALYAVGLTLLFSGADVNSKCKWCKYMSCVPTSSWQCSYNSTLPSCQILSYNNGTGYLVCPNGQQYFYNGLADVGEKTRRSLCVKDCYSP